MARLDEIRQLADSAGAALSRLSPRERTMVFGTASAVVLFAVLLTTLSVSRAIDRRVSRIAVKARQLEEVAQLTSGYAAAERDRTDLERRLRGNTVRLFSAVEELGKKLQIDIGGMSDKGSQPVGDGKIAESSVEVSLMRIDLDKFNRFLQEIETGIGIVKVKKMQIRPRNDEPLLDAWIVVATYQSSS